MLEVPRQVPALQGCLVERAGLALDEREIVQRVGNEDSPEAHNKPRLAKRISSFLGRWRAVGFGHLFNKSYYHRHRSQEFGTRADFRNPTPRNQSRHDVRANLLRHR